MSLEYLKKRRKGIDAKNKFFEEIMFENFQIWRKDITFWFQAA